MNRESFALSPPAKGRAFRPLAALLLAGVVLLAYGPALRGAFIWDDDFYVSENRLLRAPDGLWRIWFTNDFESQYFPLTITVLRFAYQLWGLDTLGYHLLNLALHIGNAWLVWALLARLEVPGAAVAAAIFALHPVQVESVAWITEIKNLLSTSFYLLSVWAYLRFEDERRGRWYGAAFALFLLGLFAKTVVCTLPGVLLILRWWRGEPVRVRDVALVLPFVGVGVGMGLYAAWYEVSHIGTTGPTFALGIAERCLIAGRAVWFYLGKLALPVGLAFSYPRWDLAPRDPLQWVPGAGLIVVGLVLWLGGRRLLRGPAAALGCFVAVLSPLLGFVNYYTMRYSFVADHYQYLACVAPVALLTAAVAIVLQRRPLVAGALAAAVLGLLAALTWRQAHAYRDSVALWRDTIAKNPGSWMAHNNLGNELVDRDDDDAALRHYEEARRLNPDYADPYNNIAGVYVRRDRFDDAFALFERAIALEPENPDFAYNLAIAYGEAGRAEEAVRTFRAAIALAPGHHSSHNNLANLLLARGDVAAALEHYGIAAALVPNDPALRENLGAAFATAGRHEEALNEFNVALALRPNDPVFVGAVARELVALGRVDAALAAYEQALAAAPDDTTLRYDFAVQLGAAGRHDAAVAQYREVLRRAPGDVAAANNLAVALNAMGDGAGAVALLEEALRTAPSDADVRYNLTTTLYRTGQIGRAIAVAEEGLAQRPDEARQINFLAWLRATAAGAEWRDGALAVRLAERANALTGHEDPNYLDTLGAAYAEAGRYDDAVRTTERALDLVTARGSDGAPLAERLALYRAGRPYRAP